MPRPVRSQSGLTLVELLIGMAIALTLIVPLFTAVSTAGSAQRTAGAVNDVNREARFALRRMAAAVRRTPATTALGAKAPATTGNWLAPDMYCLNGAGAVVETLATDVACAGGNVVASGVTAFSVGTYNAGYGAAKVIEIQLTVARGDASATLLSRTRLGGGTL